MTEAAVGEVCKTCGVSLEVTDVRDATYCAGCARYTTSAKVAAGEVEVTRKHRAAVLDAMQPSRVHRPRVITWLETGDLSEMPWMDSRHEDVVALNRLAEAIATAEARGRSESSSELDKLQGEVARLEAELRMPEPGRCVLLVEDGSASIGSWLRTRAPGGAELEADIRLLRAAVGQHVPGGRNHDAPDELCFRALSRIAAALRVRL